MKVTTVAEKQPNVVITISWREAEILRYMFWNIDGKGEGRDFIRDLSEKLNNVGVPHAAHISFSGNFK